LIKAALDAGAAGIMVPMVNSKEDAERAVKAAKYAPQGQRGIGPWRGSNYYTDFPAYFAGANAATVVVLQIESADAVKNIREIAAVPGGDCLFVGPFDLAGSMGLPVGVPRPELAAAIKKVAVAARRAKKAAGIDIGSLDALPGYVEMGFSVFTHGADMSYLIDGARAASAAFRQRAAKRSR
jgi:2-keto-3-deoxy-L-rhamnonate aldolase RhmA